MSDFIWTEELTNFALRNVKHATWAVCNCGDMQRIVERLQVNGGAIKNEERPILVDELGVQHNDVFDMLKHLRLVNVTEDETELTTVSEPGDRPGFFLGSRLGELIEDLGIDSPQGTHVLGHNFLMHAREGLSFCSKLLPPGLPKAYLKEQLLDHYVFNAKLNSFKFDNLIRMLMEFGVVQQGTCGLVIKHAPPVLTFYQMVSSYFYLSGWRVNYKIDARSLFREVNNIIPQRDEDYAALGLDQSPIEGWGRHQAWMTPSSFSKMLEIGLIETSAIVKILQNIIRDGSDSSRAMARSAATSIKRALLEDLTSFGNQKPIGCGEVIDLLERVEKS